MRPQGLWDDELHGASGFDQQARMLTALQRLLMLDAIDLEAALNQAADVIADVLQADKADVFLHDTASESLVALGTSRTPMGRRQREFGLDRLPLANGGGTVQVFQTGRSRLGRYSHRERD